MKNKRKENQERKFEKKYKAIGKRRRNGRGEEWIKNKGKKYNEEKGKMDDVKR